MMFGSFARAEAPAELIQLRYHLPADEVVEIHHSFGPFKPVGVSVFSDDDLQMLIDHYERTKEPVIIFDRVSDSELSRSPSSEKKKSQNPLDTIRLRLELNQIPHETVLISDSEVEGVERALVKIKKTVKGAWVKPEPSEIKLGTVMSLYRLGISSYVWFAASSIPTEVAVALTLFQTSLTAIFSITGRTADKLFSARFMKGDYTASSRHQFIRRQLFGLLISELILLGALGPKQLATLEAQARLLANSILLGTGDAVFANVRHNTYSNHPKTYARLGFLGFTILAPIALMDLIGMGGPTLVDVGFYQLKASAIAMVGVYTGLIAAMKLIPEKLQALLDLPSRYIAPFKKFRESLVSSKIISSCGRFIKKMTNPLRSPSSYIQVVRPKPAS
jgi:hypothetical protein